MPDKKNKGLTRCRERGSVIFYILIAVALLGALTFAISQSNRGAVSSVATSQIELMATDILEYSEIMANAVAQLRLRRADFDEISFAHNDLDAAYGVYDADPVSEVFNPSGGGIRYQAAPANAMTAAGDYKFVATNEVKGQGKTCAADSCADLVMLVRPLSLDVCVKINDIINVTNPGGAPPQESDVDDSVLFAGTASYQETIGDDAGASAVQNKPAACVEDLANGDYVFYQLLWAR